MQELPGAPGTARQGRTGTSVPTDSGGVATQPRAPGHERPRAALRAAGHGRLSAATGAPGADVPLATTARAPGHHCLSAAPRAPGHGTPLAITAEAPCRDRLSAALRAPADDTAPAITATPLSHHRPSAAPIATVSLPAGPRRLRQEGLPRVPANPRTPICSPAHQDTARTRTVHSQASPSPCRAGGPQGGQVRPPASSLRRQPQSSPRPAARRRADSPSLPGKGPGDRSKPHHTWHYPCSFGLSGLRSKPHHVYPAVQQAPPHPRSCSTACTGFFHQHPSRAPPRPPNNHSRRTNE